MILEPTKLISGVKPRCPSIVYGAAGSVSAGRGWRWRRVGWGGVGGFGGGEVGMGGLDWDGRASRVGVVSLETTTASDTDSGRHFFFIFFYSVCRGDMLHTWYTLCRRPLPSFPPNDVGQSPIPVTYGSEL